MPDYNSLLATVTQPLPSLSPSVLTPVPSTTSSKPKTAPPRESRSLRWCPRIDGLTATLDPHMRNGGIPFSNLALLTEWRAKPMNPDLADCAGLIFGIQGPDGRLPQHKRAIRRRKDGRKSLGGRI
ncbi:hypothetical protein P154DRAFT_568687 [Amniculicola lignicola CBS 123094]|uniref:Uncharacterized protein n=1 Tax=Amniculicola lignicola CBS 123094 TaxID=1392246 RepID=A0A6A5X4H2_9PLEO|nr:hypothetical protein P154DRAFT_568687 [Amniculicola lignicola CBS 123094]